MFRSGDGEHIGGVGFGDDQYPNMYHFHSDMSIYGNGSTTMNRDPYIPIENEEMGRDWASNEFDSTEATMHCAQKIYPYHNVYDTCDPFMRKDYYLDSRLPQVCNKLNAACNKLNATCMRENLMTNFPTFHSQDPMVAGLTAAMPIAPMMHNNIYLIVIFFILLVSIIYMQHVQIMHLTKNHT